MNASAEKIEEQAQAWINSTFSDPGGHGYWQNRYSEGNMEEAFSAGYAAALAASEDAHVLAIIERELGEWECSGPDERPTTVSGLIAAERTAFRTVTLTKAEAQP